MNFFRYIGQLLRDLVPLISEILLNIVFVFVLKRYYEYKSKTDSNACGSKNTTFEAIRLIERNNDIIAIYMSFLSSFIHIISLLALHLNRSKITMYVLINMLIGLLVSTRNSCNIFIFLKLNKKFRNNFWHNFAKK